MVAASVRSVSTGSSEFSNVTVNKPTGAVTGDRLVAICFRDEGHGTNAWTGATFTKVGELNVTGRGLCQVWERTVVGGEVASYVYTEPTGNSTGTVHLFAIQDVDPSMVTVAAFAQSATATASIPAPSILAASYTGTDPLLLCGFDAWSEGVARTFTTTTPTGMTTRGQINPTNTYIVTYAASLGLTGQVATGSRTATVSAVEPYISCSVVIPSPLVTAAPKKLFLPF
jgi:hypothetical protein